jgi:Type II secretory pathway, pullulanase PulA and related glycosidases
MMSALRYWVTEMHIDGFRFDLASALKRGEGGTVLSPAPILEAIIQDPVLQKTILIAEPWDASGLYQVGNFSHSPRWSEWNAQYRDIVRRYIRGIAHERGRFATKISGSEDLFSTKTPGASLNFITCHDGFTLNDLVSYNNKHNLSNLENNQDGANDNWSWNCGVEGITKDQEINRLRERQKRNFLLALILSQGPIMFPMGDEYGHTKSGNNNTWCHDSPLNWLNWNLAGPQTPFWTFFEALLYIRRNHAILNSGRFLREDDITWHGKTPEKPQWDKPHLPLGFTLKDNVGGYHLYAVFNPEAIEQTVTLPKPPDGSPWFKLVETWKNPPEDVSKTGTPYEDSTLTLPPYSSALFKVIAPRTENGASHN